MDISTVLFNIWIKDCYAAVEADVSFTFNELSFLYRDARSLEYLVRKNKEYKYLKEIYDIIQRTIRHYYDNRIDSLTYFKQSLFACYTSLFVQFSLSWKDSMEIYSIKGERIISMPQACCTSSNRKHLSSPYRTRILTQSYPTYQDTQQVSRLQDMKAVDNCVVCLFTGSPSPLQMFSLEGELIGSIITGDQIVGAQLQPVL
ncbi:hypothetical protein LOD99_6695 [Oopsacas minuta]|uniref:Uncharacterized protein n=1 Tax=Oopsacas minuta TaxID=111878 RepID=A0AAV7JL08_9METZ|nr:hypothetical protein LOD99_6695 [Oopsacas minuta]